MKPVLFIAVVFMAGASALGQGSERNHPIDERVAALFDQAGSTVAMVQAAEKGAALWDAELNRCYAELKKKLTPGAFAALQGAQRQWLAFRDAQLKALNEFYAQFDGTMYSAMRADAGMALVRARAMELYGLLETVKEHRH